MINTDNLKYYLNTHLQGAVFTSNNNYNVQIMTGLSENSIYTHDNSVFTINTFIPIMRHLDCLIQEIKYKNIDQAVIPLFEMAKLSGVVYCDKPKSLMKVELTNEDYGKTLYVCSWECEKDGQNYKFFYSKEKQSFYHSKAFSNDLPKVVSNQMHLINALYMWHFWLGSDEYFNKREILDMRNL